MQLVFIHLSVFAHGIKNTGNYTSVPSSLLYLPLTFCSSFSPAQSCIFHHPPNLYFSHPTATLFNPHPPAVDTTTSATRGEKEKEESPGKQREREKDPKGRPILSCRPSMWRRCFLTSASTASWRWEEAFFLLFLDGLSSSQETAAKESPSRYFGSVLYVL